MTSFLPELGPIVQELANIMRVNPTHVTSLTMYPDRVEVRISYADPSSGARVDTTVTRPVQTNLSPPAPESGSRG